MTRAVMFLPTLIASMSAVHAQYTTGDYGSTSSGAYSAPATWSRWTGTAWSSDGTVPSSTSRVFILTGRTVFTPATGPYYASDLIVQSGAKLWSQNSAANIYVYIYGTTLQCDGQIGDGSTFDGLAFNIEGANVTISGSGQFDASRLRKDSNANATTNLVISMDVNLRFNMASTTQIYNNFSGTSTLNVTINPGVTVNLTGSGGGNIALDGVDGLANTDRGGTFTVNGTLNVTGKLYLTTNNVSNPCAFVINNGGAVHVNQIDASASGPAGHTLTVNNGGLLDIYGTVGGPLPPPFINYSTTNNTYALGVTSTVDYSGSAAQTVVVIPGGYGKLRISGSGTGIKSLNGLTSVRSDLDIVHAPGFPVLDVTASNFALYVGGNWTNYAPTGFNERNGLVRLNGTGLQVVSTEGGETYNNLVIIKSAGAQVRMDSGVDIVAQLSMSGGVLDLNGQELLLENGSATAITGGTAARYIISEQSDNSSVVRWRIGATTGAHLIPFGKSTAYLPFTFNLTSGNAGDVRVATYGTGANNLPWPPTVSDLASTSGLLPDNRDATVDRFWQVGTTGAPTASLTFTYASAELPASPYNSAVDMRAQQYAGSSTGWQAPLGGQASSSYSTTVTNVTQFGPWALASVNSVLPIELLSFDAIPVNDHVDVQWVTASERNNDHFDVLRSNDGITFTPVARLAGALSSSMPIHYATVDPQPLEGMSYYRLRQVDVDGRSTESNTVAVSFTQGRNEAISIQPNPASDRITVRSVAGITGTYSLLDLRGQVIRTETPSALGGMEVSDLPPGIYFLRAEPSGAIARFAISR